MSVNKRKILQSAQKHLQKGALDKALKDYQTLLQADPKDANVRLKIGDIHLKQGNTQEAITAYLRVADRFMKDGFDAKAVALYKQITKIDPKRVDVYEPLAELYQRLGLTSDAMAALQTAADAQYREGNRSDALDLLRKMAALDPANTTSRLKVADLLRQEGRTKEALAEFDEVAAELERQGDLEGRIRVLERIVESDSSRIDAQSAIGRAHLDGRRARAAEQVAQAILAQQPEELEGHEILAEALELGGRSAEAADVWRKVAELYKERGNDARARDIMQRFVSTEALAADDSDPSVLAGVEPEIDIGSSASDLGNASPEFSDPGYLSDDGLRLGDPIDGIDEDDASQPPEAPADTRALPPLQAFDGGGAATGEAGDPEQLLAEASVYLRYGKHERAIDSLRAIVARVPDHRGALEKLGDAFSATGDVSNAVAALSRAAESARAEGDAAGVDALRERVAALDPAAAAAIALGAEPDDDRDEAAAASGSGVFEDIDIEVDEDDASENTGGDEVLEEPTDELEISGAGLGAEEPAEHLLDDSGDEEISFELDEAEDAAEPDAEDPDEVSGSFELDIDVEDEDAAVAAPDVSAEDLVAAAAETQLELDAPEVESDDLLFSGDDEAGGEGAEAEEAPQRGESQSSATTPQQIVESLEEADFYYQQGMLEEARALYERVIAVAPNHPQAQLRLGEIEAAAGSAKRGPETGARAPEAARSEAAAPEPGGDLGLGLSDDGLDWDEDDAAAEDEDSTPPARAPAPIEVTGPLLEEPAVARGRPEDTAPSLGDLSARPEAGDFDLAAELSGALDESGAREPARAGTTEDEGFEQVFAAFKEGVRRELGEGDHQAHYDLGIAYKEMGLLDDAIAEFGKALAAPERKLPCLHMMGLCALELGRATDAVAHLEQALALPGLPRDQIVPLRFDLGRAYGSQGDRERARACFEQVREADPDFADIDQELADLEAAASGAATEEDGDGEEEAFESFDDLMEDSAVEAAAAPAGESFESFEDLMGEPVPEPDDGEAERDAAADAALETEPEPTLEPEPDAEPDPEAEPEAEEPQPAPTRSSGGRKGGGGRRKKISYV